MKWPVAMKEFSRAGMKHYKVHLIERGQGPHWSSFPKSLLTLSDW